MTETCLTLIEDKLWSRPMVQLVGLHHHQPVAVPRCPTALDAYGTILSTELDSGFIFTEIINTTLPPVKVFPSSGCLGDMRRTKLMTTSICNDKDCPLFVAFQWLIRNWTDLELLLTHCSLSFSASLTLICTNRRLIRNYKLQSANSEAANTVNVIEKRQQSDKQANWNQHFTFFVLKKMQKKRSAR